MFNRQGDGEWTNPLPGIGLRTRVYGVRTLMAEFRLEEGSSLPMHAHPHEQSGYLVAGHLRLTVGDQLHDMLPGDAWCITGDVVHGAEALEDSVAIEVFSPVREDYMPAQGDDRP